MKIALIIVGAVVALIVTLVIVFNRIGAKFEPYAEKVLLSCRDGKYEEVYRDAAEGFRKEASLDTFRAYMELRGKSLGQFKSIVKKTGGGIEASTETGTVGTVSLDLAYEKGEAEGEFQFKKDGDEWRLLGVTIKFDDKLAPKADRAALEPLCRELLDLYDASSFDALYQHFSPALKDAWKPDAYEPQIRDLRAKAGKVESATLLDTKDAEAGQVRVRFDVQFEHGLGEASFSWQWIYAEWQLLGFDVHTGKK